VVARVTDDGERSYWELRFEDPSGTVAVESPMCLAYDLPTGKLYLVSDGGRRELDVRPQVHALVAYMSERNAAAGGEPVLCTRAELMDAVWAGERFHTPQDLTHLFWELRDILRADGAADLVENAPGRGYRLRTCA
jgi:DNA-binding winged helix-turn-helix (wHTH) protein